MVDNDLVAAIGTERGLYGGSDRSTGIDITNDSTIFGVVAVGGSLLARGILLLALL
jgi:hypothetical protein